MATIEIVLIAFGLAMDAFAVSLSAATSGQIRGKRAAFRLAFHFGLFQFLMPLLGWLAGANLIGYVQAIDHWLAFGLLAIVGMHMIRGAMDNELASLDRDPSKGWSLIMLSIATSIDALAVGFSIGVLHTDIWYPALIIGVITGLLSVMAIRAGKSLRSRFGKRMEGAGGILLIIIGLKILIEHLWL